eukprot:199111-Chlamydomonas_euryale.AAC.1
MMPRPLTKPARPNAAPLRSPNVAPCVSVVSSRLTCARRERGESVGCGFQHRCVGGSGHCCVGGNG